MRMKSNSFVRYLIQREYGLKKKTNTNVLFTEDVGKIIAEEKATLPNKNQACELPGQTRSTMLVTFSPNGTLIASSHGDHSVRVTDIKTGKCTHVLAGHPRTPWCIAFHPSSNDILASGCLGGQVRIWDLRGGGSEVWKADQNQIITSLTFHPTDMVLVIAIANEILFWDWTQPKPFATSKTAYDYEKIRWVKFDPMGLYMYTGIANRSPVHTEEDHVGFISGEAPATRERQHLQDQYRRIVEEIRSSQRYRISAQNLPTGGVPRLADAARAPLTNPPPRVDLDAERPHSPTQVDALNNAREYASAMTRQSHADPLDLSHRQTHELLANARALAASVSRATVDGSRSRSEEGPASHDVSGEMAHSHFRSSAAPPGAQESAAGSQDSLERSSWTRNRIRRLLGNTSRSAVSESTPVSSSSDFTIWAPRLQPSLRYSQNMFNLSGSSTITTSSGGALNQGTQSATRPPVSSAAPASRSRGMSLLQSQLEGASTSAAGSSSMQQSFSTILRSRLNTSRADGSAPPSLGSSSTSTPGSVLDSFIASSVRPVTVVSNPSQMAPSVDRPLPLAQTVSSLATAMPQQSLGLCSTSSVTRPAVASVLMSHLWPSTSNANTGTLTTSTIQGQATSMSCPVTSSQPTTSSAHQSCPDQCQICGGRGVLFQLRSGTTRTMPIRPSRVSRSTSGHDDPPANSSSSSGPHRGGSLASIIETEVRQTLDQVRARRLDISETLRDLDNLRRELETTPPNSGGAQSSLQPDNELSVDSSAPGPSAESRPMDTTPGVMELMDLPHLQADSHTVSEESHSSAVIQEPDPEPTNTVPPRDIPLIVVDPYDDDSTGADSHLAYRQLHSSSATDPLSLPSDPRVPSTNTEALQHIGMFSAELERRVLQLDQRVNEIQERLRDRMSALQRDREQDLSSIRSCLGPGGPRQQSTYLRERLRERREHFRSREQLRSHLIDLRNRYSSARQVTDPPSAESALPAEETSSRPGRWDSSENLVRGRRAQEELRGIGLGFQMSIASRRQQQRQQRQRGRSWHSLQRRHLHPDYSVSILDDTVNRDDGLQAAINRAIAGAFYGTGESSVANNIINQTFRIQRWDLSKEQIPDITDSEANIVVPHCKLHNDSSVDISQDGRLLATYVHTHRGFPDNYVMAMYSLSPDNLGQCLYTKSFGPNAISVSISPCNNYVLVGLASKRLAWVFTPKQMVAQVYKLKTQEAGEDSTEHICDIMHPCDMDIRTTVSLNTARWLPGIGEGLTYGTNRGDLHIYRPGFEEEEKSNASDGSAPESNSIRRNLMQMLGMTVPRTMSIATQTVQRVRRTASTQTDRIYPDDGTI